MSTAPLPSTGAIADLPSGEPIPSGPLPSSKPTPFPLGALLAATPSNIDAFLARLNRCLSTPSGIDTTLLFLCYTSRLTGSALAALSRSALRRSAREWIALAASLPPRTTLLFGAASSASLPSTAAATVALTLATRLRALSGLLSEARTILRLWALLGMYFWARGLVQKTVRALRARGQAGVGGDEKITPADERQTVVDAGIAYSQLAVCIVFQVLENGAYLSSKGVLGWSPETQVRAGRWSARFMGVHIGIELGRLAAEAFGVVPPKVPGGGVDAWRSQVIRNMAWVPLTIHWGSEKGFVGDWMVGLLACIPGTIQMRQLWKENA